MIEHLKSIAVFAEVVRAGQFRAAADRLHMTPSAVSYHIRALEDAVGTPLLYRSTRRFTLTDSGARFLVHAETMLHAAQAGFSEAQTSVKEVTGKLTVTLTTALSHSFVSERITQFCLAHPKVDLRLHFENRESDMVAEGIDVALRIGKLRDSSFLCRKLWDMPRLLVARPEFVAEYGPFDRPEDLRGVPWIKFTGIETSRLFIGPNEAKTRIEQTGSVSVNSIEAMVDLTLNGAGLSSPPTHFVAGHIASGSLISCLPCYQITDLPVFAIWHKTTVPSPVVKVFLEHVFGPDRESQ